MKIVNTVEELINVLSKYPKDKKVFTNRICENIRGELILTHNTTNEELEYIRKRELEREKETERGRDMPTFGSRW